LVAVTVGALAAATAPAKDAPPSFFGVVPNDDLGAADYELMRQGNVGSARVTLFWQVIEESPGEFDWDRTDRLIGEFASRGIIALPNLYGSPLWLSNATTSPPVDTDQQRRGWERFVREAVSRYGQGGTFWRTVYPVRFPGAQVLPPNTWQVWNEQNGPKHFSPRPDVNKYATLLEIAKRAITAVNPGGRVLTGGLVSKPTGEGGITAWSYVKKLLKTSGGQSFDDVGLHPYAANDREIVSHIKKIRRALKKGHKKQAQVWITEVGWSSRADGSSPKLSKSAKGQKKLLKKTYSLLEKKSRRWKIGGVFWYTWRDFDGGGICDWCGDAGLVTSDLQPKPAYNAFRKVAG
jgi:GH35 family endo-1,4-beta-xylanase